MLLNPDGYGNSTDLCNLDIVVITMNIELLLSQIEKNNFMPNKHIPIYLDNTGVPRSQMVHLWEMSSDGH